MNLEIKERLDSVNKAVDARVKLGTASSANRSRVLRAEENICIESRALYSKFIDICLWGDSQDLEMAKAVRQVLTVAKECLKTDEDCRESVATRLNEFEKFCQTELHAAAD